MGLPLLSSMLLHQCPKQQNMILFIFYDSGQYSIDGAILDHIDMYFVLVDGRLFGFDVRQQHLSSELWEDKIFRCPHGLSAVLVSCREIYRSTQELDQFTELLQVHHLRHGDSQEGFCQSTFFTGNPVFIIDVLGDRRHLRHGSTVVDAQKVGVDGVLLFSLYGG